MKKLILSKKDYIKVKNNIICYIESNDLFYLAFLRIYPFSDNGYFYKCDKNASIILDEHNIFENSYFGKFIYNSLFDKNFNYIQYKDEKIDRISKNRIINSNNYSSNNYSSNNSNIIDFVNFIYKNQEANELFFTVKKQKTVLNVEFKNQNFETTRYVSFNLEDFKFEDFKFEDFIINLTKYNGIDYYNDEEEGTHFILLNSPEEDKLRLNNFISRKDIYSLYLDDNTIYLNSKNSSIKSILEHFPALSNKEIKKIINESDRFKATDSYYYISNNF